MIKRSFILRKLAQLHIPSIARAVVMVAIAGVLVWLLFQLNLFYVETIDVVPSVGNRFLFVDKEYIESELLTFEGQRIISVKTQSVKDVVLLADAFVDKVYVSKRLPSTLVVRVSEKQPAAIVRQGNINQIEQVCAGPIMDSDIVIDSRGKTIVTCDAHKAACVRLPLYVISTPVTAVESIISSEQASDMYDLVSALRDEKLTVLGYGIVANSAVVVSFSDSTRGIFMLDRIDEGITDYLATRESYSLEGRSFREIDVRFERPVVRVDKYTDWVFE
jgi:hypothetical protein